MGFRRLSALCIVGSLLFAAAEARGHHDPSDLVVLADGASTAPAWASAKFRAEGTIRINVELDSVADIAVAYAGIYDVDGRSLYVRSLRASSLESGAGVATESPAGETVRASAFTGPVRAGPLAVGGLDSGLTINLHEVPPGEYKALVFVAGNAAIWRFDISASAGEFLAGDGGLESYLFDADDFETALGAKVNVAATGPVVVQDGRVSLDIHDAPVGFFDYRASPTDAFLGAPSLDASWPTGAVKCPCLFTEFGGSAASGAGRYEFAFDGTTVRFLASQGSPILALADARLPS